MRSHQNLAIPRLGRRWAVHDEHASTLSCGSPRRAMDPIVRLVPTADKGLLVRFAGETTALRLIFTNVTKCDQLSVKVIGGGRAV